jgi:hypothetical protein
MLSLIMLSLIMLSLIMLSLIMLSLIMVRVVLGVFMLSALYAQSCSGCLHAECSYAEHCGTRMVSLPIICRAVYMIST